MSSQRKKERQRLKRKRKQAELRKERNRSVFQTLASHPGGAIECWINDNWREMGEASLIVLRDAPGGTHVFAAFLIDAWCSGLKDAFGNANASRAAFDERVNRSGEREVELVEIGADEAARMVAAAMRLSVTNGFKLPKRADRGAAVVGVKSYADADLSLFDKPVDGKYLYVGTMADLQRRLIGPPDEFLRRTDLHYTMEVGREFMPADDYEDEEEYDDEEFEDEGELGVEGGEAYATLLEAIDRVRTQAYDAIQRWLIEEGRRPHARLMDAVEVALAASMIETAAAGRMPSEDYDRAVEDLLYQKADPVGAAEAMEQVVEYMQQFPTSERMLENFASVGGAGRGMRRCQHKPKSKRGTRSQLPGRPGVYRVMMRFVLIALMGLVATFVHAAELVEQATAAPIPWDAKVAFVTCAAVDPLTGQVWAGAEGAGAWRYDGKSWRQFTSKDGLGDDFVYAIAVDAQGRVWAGHMSHGVSVFDGKAWKNYDVTTGGPLGSRVFAIKVCPAGPREGEVWMATDGGIARYSPKEDAWAYVTRAEGLPADQVQCLAFDLDGRVWAGTQCDGLALASPADNYAAWTHVDGPTRPGVEPTGDGLPSCMINDVLVTREGVVFVATPWGLGKSSDNGKTFTFRRGPDWAEKVHQRTGGTPAGFKPPKDLFLAHEDYVTCLAEDEVGLLWVGYRTQGFEVIDEAAEVTKFAAGMGPGPGKPGAFVTAIVPIGGTGPFVATYGDGLGQAEKYYKGDGAAVPRPPAVARAAAAHPAPAKPPGPRAAGLMQLRLEAMAAKPKPLVAAYLGDDWTTQGDWMGRYGRQIYAFPFYGTGGWFADVYKCEVAVGPHQNKNKGGPYTYFHGLKASNERVLYTPNSASRYPGEWNDGSFDRDAYHDEWEGPDLWVDVTVPAGTHRVTPYFMNLDAHGGLNRRRDFLIELKAFNADRAAGDFAPALARARVNQFHGGVYKQFVVAGPGRYSLKVGRNYSLATKVQAVFVDRLVGPSKPNEPSGVPLMGEIQVKPPAFAMGNPATEPNAARRAAAAVWTALDAAWGDAAAVSLQHPYRALAIRLAAANGAGAAQLENWRFAVPLTTDDDHKAVAKTIVLSKEAMYARNPQMINTAFRTTMRDNWKRFEPLVKAGKAPDPATIALAKVRPVTPEEIKAALAPYLLMRAQQAIDTRDLSNDAETPDYFFSEFKAVEKDTKRAYRTAGEFLLYSEAFAQRPGAKQRRQALAAALATTRAASELMDDTWLAARASEAMLLPQLANATAADGPLSRQAVLGVVIVAHADDPAALTAAFKRLIDAAANPAEAGAICLDLAKAMHAAKRNKEALAYLEQIGPRERTAEVEGLRKELAKP